MNVVDSVEIRFHPLNLTRMLRAAHERGAKVIRVEAGWTINGLPVIDDPHVNAGDGTPCPTAGATSGATSRDR